MNLLVITCPQCRFSREVSGDKIPATARQVNCPRCGEKFPLPPRHTATEPAEEHPAPQPTEHPAALPREIEETPPATRDETADAGSVPTQPLPPTPNAPAEAPQPRRVPFVFTGTASGYFGIWIVNALLKVVTLGLYSPWAKVRKRRYFFGNTLLDQANFDYLADPMALLRGLLLAGAVYFGFALLSNLVPLIGQVIGLLFILAVLPWLVVRSRMFNTRYSSHRNIRFNFYPNYREAYIAYAGFVLLTMLTFGLAAPYAAWRQKRFLVENSRFGRTPFTFHAKPRDYYVIALKTLGVLILVVALFTSLAMATTGGLTTFTGSGLPEASAAAIFIAAYFGFIAAYLLVVLFWQVRVINLTWSSTRLGPHRLICNLRTRDMLWIYFSSGIAIMLSFGLLIPWAAVRVARYRVSRTALIAHGDLDSFVSAVTDEVDAAGEQISDLFDVDIELGF